MIEILVFLLSDTRHMLRESLRVFIFWFVMSCGLAGGYILLPSSALKMHAVCYSERLVSAYKSTRSHYIEDQQRYLLSRENLKFHVFKLTTVTHARKERH
jgi:hypothetical protein